MLKLQLIKIHGFVIILRLTVIVGIYTHFFNITNHLVLAEILLSLPVKFAFVNNKRILILLSKLKANLHDCCFDNFPLSFRFLQFLLETGVATESVTGESTGEEEEADWA